MSNTPKFGNPQIAEKLAAQFGAPTETITVEMKYAEQITEFLEKIEKAHEDAATSTLVFK
jgi:low affinity Fe/Cu permease